MSLDPKQPGKLTAIRITVEAGVIVFLLYSTLLMREFTHISEHRKTLALAVSDIFTLTNLVVAIISGLIGSIVFEYLRKHL
jgi:hypothetical protein